MHHRIHLLVLSLSLALAGASAAVAQQPARLELKSGEHIALIGGALADRLQHSGHFETLIHAAHPELNLVVRNLAVSGDEVVTRARSENFGSPDDWLTRTRADVIFAFFGYNESFKGYEGLDKFKADLDKFLKNTLTKDYSDRGAPRIVLFSPIADEKHQDPNFPDPARNNANLSDYTDAMSSVARQNGVIFVDLFKPSQAILAAAAKQQQSLTVNGHYLTDAGDEAMAPVLFRSVFGANAPTGDYRRLRDAVNEKNLEWHRRYRTMDGYNVYGGRSALAYQPGKGGFISDRGAAAPYISNYKVMQEEMSQRDVMTANRDQRVWAVAKGGDLKVDDSNLPPVTPVKSNKPFSPEQEIAPFLSGTEAMTKMTVHSGMKVNLFADEKQFPDLINPVQMMWDTRGRLWVSAWRNYPERRPTDAIGDKILVFEDTNGDGQADKVTTFADDLNCPTGFQFYRDGLLLMQAPDLWFLRDTNGDGQADWKERVLMGMDSADSHHTANAICHEPGGAIYLSDGVFHRTQVETAYGPVRNNDGAIYRFEPRSGKFETYISYGFANPHGRIFDRWGNDFVTDATGNENFFGPAFSGRIDYPAKHPGMRQFWARPSRPCPGTGILTSRHFPEEFQGNFLNINVISFQGIYRVKVTEDGSGLKGETMENLISSSDVNFRPICVSIGPDGAIYFCDWANNIIGHMQHHIRDPNRDKLHGRIYRITYEGRPLLQAKKIDGQPIPSLLDLLKEAEDGVRELAKIELGKHDSAQVIAATKKWVAGLDRQDPNYAHQLTEALWVDQWHNVVDNDLLKRVLASTDHRARAAAGRVLCYWRDRVPDALALFRRLAEDEHPRPRLEAVRAASFYRSAEAADIALAALKKPTDYYIDYTLKETLRQLEPQWRKAIAEGQPIAADNPAGINRLIGSVNTAELLKMPRTPGVLMAVLSRPDVPDAARIEALDGLAKERGTSRVTELLKIIQGTLSSAVESAGGLARLLPLQPPDELKANRASIARLLTGGNAPEIRQPAWAALAQADGGFDVVWAEASKSVPGLTDLLGGIPYLSDPDFRAQAYDRVSPLIAGAPSQLQSSTRSSPAVTGRFVRIELPRRGTLTLAEVEVLSGGKNIALQGKARQSSVSNGGEASRAIDGKTDGLYGSGTQTHSQENERNPWWEVDLGGNRSIDSVTVWNRTEGELSKRLEGFTLKVLDADREVAYEKKGVPAPATSAKIELGSGDPIVALRLAAIRATVAMPKNQDKTFGALAGLIAKRELIVPAAQGLRILPRSAWPKDQAGAVATSLLAWAKTIPAGERTSQDFVETTQAAIDLAGFLAADQASQVRQELRGLGVSVFVLRAVREQMRYDTPRIVVELGKPFEIILVNDDFMQHNLVVVKPGAREKVGRIADAMKPDALDDRGRAFVPKLPEIISATRLLDAGQKATLSFSGIFDEGTHEYVCTYPNHWPVMWGQLVVTKDVEAYLREHPQAALPAPVQQHQHGLE